MLVKKSISFYLEESKELSCKEKMQENARKKTRNIFTVEYLKLKKIDFLKTVRTCLFADSYLAHTNLQD